MLRIDFTNRKRPDDGELLRTLSVKVSVREVSLVEEFPLEGLYCSRKALQRRVFMKIFH